MVHKVPLHVESSGSGPLIVLQHGFGGSARNFRPQARELARSARVILFDARGHARSGAPAEARAYTMAEYVRDFAGVVDGSGDELVVAGGLSMGAAVALHYALAFAPRVRGLVLAAYPASAEDERRRAWALDFAEAVEQRGLESAGADFAWGERSRFDPKGAALIRQGFLEHRPAAVVHILRELLARLESPDTLAPALGKLQIPTLVIVGSEDTGSLEPSRRLSSLLPDAELVVVPGAGHVVNLANPAAFNDAVRQFLGKLVKRPQV